MQLIRCVRNQHRLTGIVEEMGEAMLRTSTLKFRTPAAIFDGDLRRCGRSRLASGAYPGTCWGLSWAAKVVEYFGKDVHEGDIFLLNDPYYGGVTYLTCRRVPCSSAATVGYGPNRAHHSDIGGATHALQCGGARDFGKKACAYRR